MPSAGDIRRKHLEALLRPGLTSVLAVLSLLGDKVWYLPRWLERLLPNINVEGEKLSHKVASPDDQSVVRPLPIR
ncbi:hypothetical protein ABZ016_22190 [Streptomyces sp. NPDC006372]|uniref:hypothetical protein n=1 Tax=Streptomyces sp. NPDC006372 TaxID=3155599 RepID=UPI0033BF3978